jgi:hypothetical protein
MVMNEHTENAARSALEDRSRALFRESVDGLDMRVRSRLTQARNAALDAAAAPSRPWFFRIPVWTPAGGVTAAALLGLALWFGIPGNHGGTASDQPNLEDLDMVAASDGSNGDAMEMMQDDLEFYDYADKAATSEPAA